MLTLMGLFWTEIAACFLLAIVSGLVAVLWTKQARTSSSGNSPVAVIAPSVFGSIGGVLIAHWLEGTALTTTGKLPFAAIFLPTAAIVVACGALVACFRTRSSLVRSTLVVFSGVLGTVGVLFFWFLGAVH